MSIIFVSITDAFFSNILFIDVFFAIRCLLMYFLEYVVYFLYIFTLYDFRKVGRYIGHFKNCTLSTNKQINE